MISGGVLRGLPTRGVVVVESGDAMVERVVQR